MSADKRIRIVTVEDHPVFREGLSAIIESQDDMLLVAEAATASEARSLWKKHRPDVTLIDIRLPDGDGVEVLSQIREEFPASRFVVLTTSEGDLEIKRALRAGALAYLLKNTPKHELLATIRAAHSGQRYVSAEAASRIAEHVGEENLTPREFQVLELVRDGRRNKQIADELAISETTVAFHIKNIVDKLGANDRAHAITIAVRRGLLQP